MRASKPFKPCQQLSHVRYVVLVSELHASFIKSFPPHVGLVSYDGDDSQSESEATHDIKARSTVASENDNVRATISCLVVAVSLWLAVPPFASGFRAKVWQ